MEQTIQVEECAKQRLHVLVNVYTLFVKHLMEEGLDREKVKRASDKAWGRVGAAGRGPAETGLRRPDYRRSSQAGRAHRRIRAWDSKPVMTSAAIKLNPGITSVPWQEAVAAHSLPEKWTLCVSGHAAFTENMYKGLKPGASYNLIRSTAAGDEICEGTTAT